MCLSRAVLVDENITRTDFVESGKDPLSAPFMYWPTDETYCIRHGALRIIIHAPHLFKRHAASPPLNPVASPPITQGRNVLHTSSRRHLFTAAKVCKTLLIHLFLFIIHHPHRTRIHDHSFFQSFTLQHHLGCFRSRCFYSFIIPGPRSMPGLYNSRNTQDYGNPPSLLHFLLLTLRFNIPHHHRYISPAERTTSMHD